VAALVVCSPRYTRRLAGWWRGAFREFRPLRSLVPLRALLRSGRSGRSWSGGCRARRGHGGRAVRSWSGGCRARCRLWWRRWRL